ncbi:MAG: hypothetical protein ACYDCL_20130 [Myxococcales bacterium]
MKKRSYLVGPMLALFVMDCFNPVSERVGGSTSTGLGAGPNRSINIGVLDDSLFLGAASGVTISVSAGHLQGGFGVWP